MKSAVLQIKAAFEDGGMTPEEIAEDQELELGAVKAALMQSSSKYRKMCGKEDEELDDLNFSNDELRSINKQILYIALNAETNDGRPDFRTQLAACEYVRDDKKGRKEVMKQVQGNTFNILQLNSQFKQAREAAKQATQQLIEA